MKTIKIFDAFTPAECEKKVNMFLEKNSELEIDNVISTNWGTKICLIVVLKDQKQFDKERFKNGIIKAAEYFKAQKE